MDSEVQDARDDEAPTVCVGVAGYKRDGGLLADCAEVHDEELLSSICGL
jgi:hypothetical protein